MGGKVLDYEAKDILNKGREEGLKEGRMDHFTIQVQKSWKEAIQLSCPYSFLLLCLMIWFT